MKTIALLLALALLLCGCGAGGTSSDTQSTVTSSGYIDEDVDFTGKVTIVGRWKCVRETQRDGTVRDATEDESYYIFQSDGTMESKYSGSILLDYTGYSYEDGKLSLFYGNTTIPLNCEITETTLKLSTTDGGIITEYIRVDYE